MTAKFANRCPICRQPIAVGAEIEKTKSGRFAHEGCAVQESLYRPNAHPYYQAQLLTCPICGKIKRNGEIITRCAADDIYGKNKPYAHSMCTKEQQAAKAKAEQDLVLMQVVAAITEHSEAGDMDSIRALGAAIGDLYQAWGRDDSRN